MRPGISKSSVSRRFIEATEAELKSLLSRPLAELDIVVLLIDGVQFSRTNVLAAMGFDMDGHKHILWPTAWLLGECHCMQGSAG